MKPVQKQSVKKNYIYNLAYQMLAVIIPLMIQPYIARVLGAGEVGAFSYTTAITGYFALVGNLGIATYGQLRVAAFRNDRKVVSRIFWELAILRLLLMTGAAAIFLLFIKFLARPEYKTLYLVLIVQIFASAIDIAWLLQGFEEFRKIVLRNTLTLFNGLNLLLGLCLALIPALDRKGARKAIISITLVGNALLVLPVLLSPDLEQPLFRLSENLPVFLHSDATGKCFAALISVVWCLAGFYSFEYMEHAEEKNRFFAFYLMTYGITLGVAFSGNILTLYVFYEML